MARIKIIPIDGVDSSDRWVPVPNPSAGTLRLKGLYRKKGKCYFAKGVPDSLMPFCYRSARRLGLHERVLIFSRGAVKKNGSARQDMVSMRELDWDVGTSIIIPRSLRKDRTICIAAGERTGVVNLMELIVLAALFKLSTSGGTAARNFLSAGQVLLGGWKSLNRESNGRLTILTAESPSPPHPYR